MVTQLQYTAWPDHDVPKSAEPLIEMNKTLRALQGNRKQQVLIHCRSVPIDSCYRGRRCFLLCNITPCHSLS